MEGAIARLQVAGVCEDVGEESVDEGDEEKLIPEDPREMSRLK